MCQLLGMNCNVPTDICFSFTGFQQRGGITDEHADGWGIAFFEGKGVRQFLDSNASAHSPIAELVRSYPIKSKNVISHIRKATQGQVRLENTHPFMRELWGQYWIFAHNGNIKEFNPEFDGTFLPVGDTDSETAFCYIMQNLKKKFGVKAPETKALFEELRRLSIEISGDGSEFNFLFSNGDLHFAHASTHLAYIVRRAPFKKARLKDQDMTVDFSEVASHTDRVAIIATLPLTHDEEWVKMDRGTLWLFREGDVLVKGLTVPGVESNPICAE